MTAAQITFASIMRKAMAAREPIGCEQCGTTIGNWSHGRLRIRVENRYLFVKGGQAEITCGHCRQPTRIPLTMEPA